MAATFRQLRQTFGAGGALLLLSVANARGDGGTVFPPTGPTAAELLANHSPRAIEKIAPVLPPEFGSLQVRATADIECLVDTDGHVTEAKVLAASHPEFGEAALTAARRWRFEPGMREGHPASYRIMIPFIYKTPVQEALENFFHRKIFFELDGPVVPAESLPKWPVASVSSWPHYPAKLQGSGLTGSAVIAFVINQQGEVINPELIKATHPEFVLPAMAAIVSQRFAPVLDAHGQALSVSMLIQYNFDEKEQARRKRSPR